MSIAATSQLTHSFTTSDCLKAKNGRLLNQRLINLNLLLRFLWFSLNCSSGRVVIVTETNNKSLCEDKAKWHSLLLHFVAP